jgi:hypothetical protein
MINTNTKIYLNKKSNNAYDVTDKNGNLLLGADDNYYIYFKNVNFRADGTIDGRYLGTLTDDSVLIDGYCRDVSYGDGGFKIEGGKAIRTARMVAVNNKSKTIVIIQS